MFKNLNQESKVTSNQFSKVGRTRPKNVQFQEKKRNELDSFHNKG